MTSHNSRQRGSIDNTAFSVRHWLVACAVVLAALSANGASAQELRYSWLDLSFTAQDVDRQGTQQTPVPGQTTSVDAKDGDGVRFRGSFGTWYNLYGFGEYGSSDIDVDSLVSNDQGDFPASDEFDLTTIRGGIGWRYPLRFATDIYVELTYDSIDYDFGSFAGESFDIDDQDIGGAIGIRHMLNDDIQVYAYGRYSNHADVDLDNLVFDAGQFYGAGLVWEIVRGLALVADFESGEITTWAVGFRLDLDED
jgi:hypothetical protein